MKKRRLASGGISLGVVIIVVGAVALLAPGRHLVRTDGIAEVTEVRQGEDAADPPGWIWCDQIAASMWSRRGSPATSFELTDGTRAGALLIDRSAGRLSAADILRAADAAGRACAESGRLDQGFGLQQQVIRSGGGLVWQASAPNGRSGEYALIALDDARVLAVGLENGDGTARITLDDVIALAEQGAQQFPAES